MVHVVKDHVDAPLEVVAFVSCTPQEEGQRSGEEGSPYVIRIISGVLADM